MRPSLSSSAWTHQVRVVSIPSRKGLPQPAHFLSPRPLGRVVWPDLIWPVHDYLCWVCPPDIGIKAYILESPARARVEKKVHAIRSDLAREFAGFAELASASPEVSCSRDCLAVLISHGANCSDASNEKAHGGGGRENRDKKGRLIRSVLALALYRSYVDMDGIN